MQDAHCALAQKNLLHITYMSAQPWTIFALNYCPLPLTPKTHSLGIGTNFKGLQNIMSWQMVEGPRPNNCWIG